jgi:glycosyltransferase involved in cell wall biosynthesis
MIAFSVVIPLFNKRNHIQKTLNSVLDQTWRDYEIIVVDDGSTDGSPEIVRQFSDDRIRLVTQPNAGVSAARNAGIRQSKYSLIAFLDADDLWEPGYMAEMAGFIEMLPEAGMYGCAFDKITGGSSFTDDFHLPVSYKGMIDKYFRQAVSYHLYSSSSVIIRKSVTEKSGFFDERISIGEDHDFWFRVAFHYKVAFFNRILVHYNVSADNRAMLRKHPYSKSNLCYTGKYREMEKQNPEFKYFINYYRITMIPKLLLKFDPGKKEIKEFMNEINPAGQNLYYRLFLKMPLGIKRIFSVIYLKYRGLEP